MIHRFILFSEEVEGFVMEIKAPSTSTFQELFQTIMEACDYIETGNHRFLICDEDWHVEKKIYLHTRESRNDEDVLLMDECYLEDYIEDEGQRIAFVYDVVGKKVFLMEMVENIFGEKMEKVIVSRRKGQTPPQFEIEEIPEIPTTTPTTPQPIEEPEENFYGDDTFDDGEIDMEGFEVEERG